MFFSVITKNLNWEILTKNLVTFKRWDFLLTAIWSRPILGNYQGGNLTHPMLITCVLHIQPKGHQEPCNKVGSPSPAEHLMGFEPGTFWLWSQCLNPLGHYPHGGMELRIKNLKNQIFRVGGWFMKKQYIGGITYKCGLGQFADFRGGLGKKEGWGLIHQCTLWNRKKFQNNWLWHSSTQIVCYWFL